MHHVQQHGVEGVPVQRRHRRRAVGHGLRLQAGPQQVGGQHLLNGRVVVRDQHPGHAITLGRGGDTAPDPAGP